MKNTYLVLSVVIALAVFILGMAIFIAQKRSDEVSQPAVETIQTQTEGTEGSAVGSEEEIAPLQSTPSSGQSAPEVQPIVAP